MLKSLVKNKVTFKNDYTIITKMFNLNFSTQEVQVHRANLFEYEKQKQMSEIVRIEKIDVNVIDGSKEHKLVMNKFVSTPLNCAMHISELLVKRSVLALVDDQPWDMNRPLDNGCKVKFLHFKDPKPYQSNLAYWRSCSFVLGSLVESAFKNKYKVDICSFPYPDLNIGSFCYDALLNIPDWKPSKEELRCLSVAATKLIRQNIAFERLKIKQDIAEEMFKHNKFKLQQISQIVKKLNDNDRLVVYKLGDFVDISQGPMISNTSLMGRFEVTGIFDLETKSYGKIQRIQGISIPYQLRLHDWTFNLLAERASTINSSQSPALV